MCFLIKSQMLELPSFLEISVSKLNCQIIHVATHQLMDCMLVMLKINNKPEELI